MSKLHFPALAAVVLLLGHPSFASAHGMTVEAGVIPEHLDRIHVRAYFDDKTDPSDAVVRVRDATGQVIETGKLDAKGVWTFARPGPGSYTIRVEFVGHDQEVVLNLPDDHAAIQASSRRPNLILGVVIGLGLLVVACLWVQWRKTSRVAKV